MTVILKASYELCFIVWLIIHCTSLIFSVAEVLNDCILNNALTMEATTTTKYSNWLHVGSLRKYQLTSRSRKVYTAAASEVIICYIWTKFNLCLFHWFAKKTPHTISFGIRGYYMLHLNKFNLCLFHWFANNTPHTISFFL